uniref:flagellar hook-length control protein FliK n=1 Tax=Phenylobacterium sp. TaxID=1871053 RepID=UPI0025E5D8DE
GQPPAEARLDPEAGPAELIHRLRGDVDQALARQTLCQLASGPDGGPPHWLFELPLATPQGAAIAQFAIEADDAPPEADGAGPIWRARFALDLPPLGPVHVNLRMTGGRTAATLWAETPEALSRLRERGGELADELGGDVAFRAGAPTGAAPPPGRLLDHRS